ncbi:hypothetical protein [Actinoplanes aureus]|uniref:DUF3592 domain-containing protein n=1 Tax=Actinoplanes aureus TaxID=2792083 RepID=A0A931CE86_9ACTN|nr:hypothetical protein [Actinoplanes aureus]MBG0565583.1 hypothetical protein [Actinoplanes aureus]
MKGSTWRRVAALLIATVALWLVVGVAGSLGTWLWWLVAAAPMAAFVAAPFALYWISGGRTWPTWVAFVPALVLLMTALAVPGDFYMRELGTPAAATVGEATCTDNGEGRCLYNYTLYDGAGRVLPGEFRDTVEYAAGSRLDVVTDPRGYFGPRLAADVRSRVFEVITLIAFALYLLVVVAAGLIGRRPVTSS